MTPFRFILLARGGTFQFHHMCNDRLTECMDRHEALEYANQDFMRMNMVVQWEQLEDGVVLVHVS